MADDYASAAELEDLRTQVRDFQVTLVGTKDWPVGRIGVIEKEVRATREDIALIPQQTKQMFLEMLESSNARRDLGYYAKVANIVVAIFIIVVAAFLVWHFGFNK